MTSVHDVAIIGAGAMGSAAAWALGKAGRDVVVLEQFDLGHDRGGSHGATRIFRVGTEQAHYLNMAERAVIAWDRLEGELDTPLRTFSGAVEHGITDAQAAEFSAMLTIRGIGHAVLSPGAAMERWPGMRFDGPVLFQSGGAILHADRAVAGLQRLATGSGVEFRPRTRVERLRSDSVAGPVELTTSDGTVRAHHVIATAGPWVPKLLDDVTELPAVTVTQEQPRFYAPLDPAHEWPCFVHWRDDGGEWGRFESYGLLEEGVGVKVGLHASGPPVDPDARDFAPEPLRDEALNSYVRAWFPGLDLTRSTPISCLYDNTANGDFVIDQVGHVTFATGFNGEGFKFVPLIGELLRDLALGATPPPSMFTVRRHRS